MAKPVKRAYDSSRRQAQARETQRHIAECARDLFIERGYTATSIRDIADRAGVAVQTIYNAFDGKPAIVARIADMAVVGDDEPVALREREDVVAVMEATDPAEVLAGWARVCTGIFTRFLPILPVLREAAAVDETVAGLWQLNSVERRYEGTLAVAGHLASLDALPPGLDAERTADLLFAIASFDTAHNLIVHRGWTPDELTAGFVRTFTALFGLDG